jgi:hypothetical protein
MASSAETILFEVKTKADTEGLVAVGRKLDSLEKSYRDFEKRSQITSDQLQNATLEASRLGSSASSSAEDMGELSESVSTTSNQLAFELVQGAQDAQFGLAGVANQVPLVAEQFGRLKSETGSTTSALGELLSTFIGPTGLLAIGTLGLQALPAIRRFFSGMEEGASAAKKQVDDLAQATDSVVDVEGNLPTGQLNEQEAKQLRDAVREQNRQIERQLEFARRLRTAFERVREVQGRIEGLETGFETLPEKGQEQVTDQLETQRAILQDRSNQLEQLKAQSQDILGVQIEYENQLLNVGDQLGQRLQIQKGIKTALDRRLVTLRREERQLQRLRELANQYGVQLIETDLPQPRDLQQIERVEAAPVENAQNLEETIQNVELVGHAAQTQFEAVGDAQDNNNDKLARSIRLASQLGATMIQAAKGSEKEWNQVLGQILTTVGSIVGITMPGLGAGIAGVGTLLGSFDEGGYTGDLASDDVAGVVHGGEYVMSAEATRGNVAEMHAIHEAMRGGISVDRVLEISGLPGYASGGHVAEISAMTQPVTSTSSESASTGQGQNTEALRSELRALRKDVRALADRPNIIHVGRRGSKDIVEAGQEEIDRKNSGL